MSAAMRKRLDRLEHAKGKGQSEQPALALVCKIGHSDDAVIGVYGVSLMRNADEPYEAYMGRLDAHLRATRGNAMMVAFAAYADDIEEGPEVMGLSVPAGLDSN